MSSSSSSSMYVPAASATPGMEAQCRYQLVGRRSLVRAVVVVSVVLAVLSLLTMFADHSKASRTMRMVGFVALMIAWLLVMVDWNPMTRFRIWRRMGGATGLLHLPPTGFFDINPARFLLLMATLLVIGSGMWVGDSQDSAEAWIGTVMMGLAALSMAFLLLRSDRFGRQARSAVPVWTSGDNRWIKMVAEKIDRNLDYMLVYGQPNEDTVTHAATKYEAAKRYAIEARDTSKSEDERAEALRNQLTAQLHVVYAIRGEAIEEEKQVPKEPMELSDTLATIVNLTITDQKFNPRAGELAKPRKEGEAEEGEERPAAGGADKALEVFRAL
jgi:hypothetical protein